jgi:anti-anti-sigma factor
MDLPAERFADVVVVAVHGRVDHASAADFQASLEPWLAQCKAGGVAIVLNLAGLEYISSAGLRVFMLAAKRARSAAGRIVVCGLTPVVGEIFSISRFNLVLPVHLGVAAALAALSPDAAAAHAARPC